jgi:hypothetical protein
VFSFFLRRLLPSLRQPFEHVGNFGFIVRFPQGKNEVVKGSLIVRILV